MLRSIDDDSFDATRLHRWNRRFTPFVVVAALLPLGTVVADDSAGGVHPWLAIASWLILLVDLIAHVRLRPGFLSLPAGKLYVVIVVITAPLYLLLPGGARSSDLIGLVRLAWVVRLVAVAAQGMRGIHSLLSRLGQTALYALVATVLAAIIVNEVESPEDGFDNIGDSLWWSIVTITSVGYGDLVPQTTPGRITASLLMIAGLAFLGAIAATLASFLGLADAGRSSASPAMVDGGDAAAGPGGGRGDVPGVTDRDGLERVEADRDAPDRDGADRNDAGRRTATSDAQVRELAELRREITRLAALIDDRRAPEGRRGPTA